MKSANGPRRQRGRQFALAVGVTVLITTPLGALPRTRDGSAGERTAGDVTVEVGDNFFAPRTITVAAGTTVRWVNHGRNLHSLTPNRGHEFGKEWLRARRQYEFTFREPGRYAYYCSLHGAPGSGQHGTVVVTASTTTAAPASSPTSETPTLTIPSGRSRTIRVPAQVRTIQGAVDRAKTGDLVLISPGVYREAVTVTRPGIVLRSGRDTYTVPIPADM